VEPVKGFAIGRTIFAGAAKGWLAGAITDQEAVAGMEERFAHFAGMWRRLRGGEEAGSRLLLG
ncbi:MAG: DUF2090 domain-containing protein, partial [Pseudomonadota bacterium]|nr:DUF2090 domain-containing protein [Pseudomonadota bacterium]